ncbi:hypothetical protein B296_00004369 [Ensete ventricosum]|uniref:Uncharacterized protein n=1 Tax=Ensete ventricosum TaxID=4639 RepID=A0A427B2H6_ENSVE|nr:hypothetical protein B296_00004369 [Ensete ventricosum]
MSCRSTWSCGPVPGGSYRSPADWYTDRPLTGDTVEIDWKSTVSGRFQPVLAKGGDEEEGEKIGSPRTALPWFPRAICRSRGKNRPRDPSPAGDFFADGRFLLPAQGEETR